MLLKSIFFLVVLLLNHVAAVAKENCSAIHDISEAKLLELSRRVLPDLDYAGLSKTRAGVIGIVGGFYPGPSYFAAISALKSGAGQVMVLTTKSTAPVVALYSADILVLPLLHKETLRDAYTHLTAMDVIIIGPGMGKDFDTRFVVSYLIQYCKSLTKPVIFVAEGLYPLTRNVNYLSGFKSPIILLPNDGEAKVLKDVVLSTNKTVNWFDYWGKNVSVLVRGKEDRFHSKFAWSHSRSASSKQTMGEGDMLSGVLGTFFNWALKADLCDDAEDSMHLAQSVASFVASKVTKLSNKKAFNVFHRSMLTTDMLDFVRVSLAELSLI